MPRSARLFQQVRVVSSVPPGWGQGCRPIRLQAVPLLRVASYFSKVSMSAWGPGIRADQATEAVSESWRFWMSFRGRFQNMYMSRLTQGESDRSDNNERSETPFLETSTPRREGQLRQISLPADYLRILLDAWTHCRSSRCNRDGYPCDGRESKKLIELCIERLAPARILMSVANSVERVLPCQIGRALFEQKRWQGMQQTPISQTTCVCEVTTSRSEELGVMLELRSVSNETLRSCTCY